MRLPLYLATSGYGVFKSTDGGATWASFNNGLTHLDVHSLTLVPGSRTVSHRGRSSPIGSSTLYAGTPGGVFKLEQFGSTAGGAQKVNTGRNIVRELHHSAAWILEAMFRM